MAKISYFPYSFIHSLIVRRDSIFGMDVYNRYKYTICENTFFIN